MVRSHYIGWAFSDDATALKQIEVVDHLQCRLHILLDQQHRETTIHQQPNPRQQIGYQPGRQTGRWFVQHKYARAGQQRAPHSQHLPFATRERGALMVTPFGETGKEVENLGDAKDMTALYVRGWTYQTQILIDRQLNKDILAFRYERETTTDPLMRRQGTDILALEVDVARHDRAHRVTSRRAR